MRRTLMPHPGSPEPASGLAIRGFKKVRNLFLLVGLIGGASVGAPVAKAMPSPTPAQLELLKQLTPAERDALMRQYGMRSGTSSGARSTSTEQQVQTELESSAQDGADLAALRRDAEAAAARQSKARDARDLAWCEREARGIAEDIRPRLARDFGFASLEDLPLAERCAKLSQAVEEQRFTFERAELKPFGYDFFTDALRAAGTDIPVPADYAVGPGDTVMVQLYGKENAEYALQVSREGVLSFPGLGPIPVAGQRFEVMQAALVRRVQQQMIGVQASVTMGPLRSVRVFVLGEVVRPGSYTVAGLATITHALYASGGISASGSLRDIQLKRDGKVVRRLDLYDLLLAGDTSDDVRLQPGDAVFIPPVKATAAIEGQVRRPAIYELQGQTSIQQLVELAGGLMPDAYPQEATLERIGSDRLRTVVDIDLTQTTNQSSSVQAGDHLKVYSVLDKLEDVVRLSGHVYRPKFAQWRTGLRLSDLVPDASELKAKADLGYVMVRREKAPTREVEVVSTNLARAMAAPGGDDDLVLQPRDQVFVFATDEDRRAIVDPIIEEMRAQARRGEPARVVGVSGAVRALGLFPLEPDMRLSNLLAAAGGLSERALIGEAEVSRFEVVDGQQRKIAHLKVDLAAVLRGDASADLVLQPYDQVAIKPISLWGEVEFIELRGEVRFPGRYTLRRGETLQEVITRAGGLTEAAFVEGAMLTRVELQAREQDQLNRLAEKLSRELTTLSLEQVQSDQDAAEALRVGNQLAGEVRSARALGRLVFDLEQVIAGRQEIIAKGGDVLVVPRQTQEVTVLGEVQFGTSHLYGEGLGVWDYVDRSGGPTVKADRSHAFVVRANGRVDTAKRVGRMRPGDTIILPLDTERMRPLVFWSTITQIAYQLALTAASAKTVGAF
jgi:polysaccharide export outer membrane protein